MSRNLKKKDSQSHDLYVHTKGIYNIAECVSCWNMQVHVQVKKI